jgi:hypothetical protein
MEKSTVLPLIVAGLLITIGAIYLYSAYMEPIEAAEESVSEEGEEQGSGSSSGGSGDDDGGGIATSSSNSNSGLDIGTELQTAFFAVAGVASLGVAAWILTTRKKIIKPPYIVAAAGSAFLIGFYIISRTVELPVVGIQSDVGDLDIVCKVLQAAVIGLSVYAISVSRRKEKEKIKSSTLK